MLASRIAPKNVLAVVMRQCMYEKGLVIADMVVVFVGGDECNWCGLCEAECEMGAISCPFDIVV